MSHSAESDAGSWLSRLWRWLNACDGHCEDFDASDAYYSSLTVFGTTEGALERASRCYHKYRRDPYPDEGVIPPDKKAEGDEVGDGLRFEDPSADQGEDGTHDAGADDPAAP